MAEQITERTGRDEPWGWADGVVRDLSQLPDQYIERVQRRMDEAAERRSA